MSQPPATDVEHDRVEGLDARLAFVAPDPELGPATVLELVGGEGLCLELDEPEVKRNMRAEGYPVGLPPGSPPSCIAIDTLSR